MPKPRVPLKSLVGSADWRRGGRSTHVDTRHLHEGMKRIEVQKSVFRTCRRMRFSLQTDTWQKVPSMWRQRFMQSVSHQRLSALLLFAHRCGWHCLVADQLAGSRRTCWLQMVALPLSQDFTTSRQWASSVQQPTTTSILISGKDMFGPTPVPRIHTRTSI